MAVRKLPFLFILFALTLALPTSALSQSIRTFQITGTVTSAGTGFEIGDAIEAELSYDYLQERFDEYVDFGERIYYYNQFVFTATVRGQSFYPAANQRMGVSSGLSGFVSYDGVDIRANGPSSAGELELALRGPGGTIFANSNPPTVLNLEPFTFRQIKVLGLWVGEINSISIVPPVATEQSTWSGIKRVLSTQ